MIKRHINYLKYVVKHKWFVFKACLYLNVSWYNAIMHDMSKFLPSEWFPYAETFYKENGDSQYNETKEFNIAWNHHQKRNPHHWQYWLLKMDRGDNIPLEIPINYLKEMIADWIGAGRAINGKYFNENGNLEVYEWYQKNKEKIILHETSKRMLENILELLNNGDICYKLFEKEKKCQD